MQIKQLDQMFVSMRKACFLLNVKMAKYFFVRMTLESSPRHNLFLIFYNDISVPFVCAWYTHPFLFKFQNNSKKKKMGCTFLFFLKSKTEKILWTVFFTEAAPSEKTLSLYKTAVRRLSYVIFHIPRSLGVGHVYGPVIICPLCAPLTALKNTYLNRILCFHEC